MSSTQLFAGAAGIYVSYLSISLLLERVYLVKYDSILPGEKPERFDYPGLTIWLGSLFCAIFGYLRGWWQREPRNPISLKQQLILSSLYTANIIGAQYALIYVTYITKTIGGNFRYLLVVLIGVFFSRVKKGNALKLKPSKIVVAVIITFGVMLFTLMKDKSKAKGAAFNPETEWIGYLCILLSIVADSLFTDSQAYAKVTFKPTANHLFTSANFYCFLFMFAIGAFQGQVNKQIRFCAYHPWALFDLVVVSCFQVLGQASIYYVIANFKQHMFPLISTTRKVGTVFLSILVYGHKVNLWQWIGIFSVFGGMTYEVIDEIKDKKAKQNAKMLESENKQSQEKALSGEAAHSAGQKSHREKND